MPCEGGWGGGGGEEGAWFVFDRKEIKREREHYVGVKRGWGKRHRRKF